MVAQLEINDPGFHPNTKIIFDFEDERILPLFLLEGPLLRHFESSLCLYELKKSGEYSDLI